MDTEFDTLSQRVGAAFAAAGLTLATAESCTGGGVAELITDVAGSSAWFDCGFVTYSNRAKTVMLGVRTDTLATFGAVSEATAREMAAGALAHSQADWAVATTGIAGPAGGSVDKPVGTVCFGWCRRGFEAVAETCVFDGDRQSVRRQAVRHALLGLLERLAGVQ
jgi:nicotinamide-nucleotide amidase